MIKSLKNFSKKFFYYSFKNLGIYEKESDFGKNSTNIKVKDLGNSNIDNRKLIRKKSFSKNLKLKFNSINLVISNSNQFNISQDLMKKKSFNIKSTNNSVTKIITRQVIGHLSLNPFENCKTNTIIVTV